MWKLWTAITMDLLSLDFSQIHSTIVSTLGGMESDFDLYNYAQIPYYYILLTGWPMDILSLDI